MANIPPTPDFIGQLESLMKALEAGSFSFNLSQLDNLEICEPLYSEEKPKVVAKECECGKEKHGFATHATWCKKWNQGA
jgi:hypothetical protein